MVVVVVIVLLIVAGLFAFSRSSLGQGFGAASAIYEHGRPQIVRANYAEFTGQPPTMQVYLSVGVDPGLASGIGCGLVHTELAKAGLPTVPWIVFAGNGQAVADSSGPCP
jgi:hypothetical protein